MRAARRLLPTLFLPLALWSALPQVQWCAASWAEVTPECFVACAVARPSTGCAAATEACDREAPGACGRESASECCESAAPRFDSGPCGTGAATAFDPFAMDGAALPSPADGRSDRAWCLGDAGGPAVREPDLSSTLRPTPSAIAALEDIPESYPGPIARFDVENDAAPRSVLEHARPPVRAPPFS